MPLAVFSSSGTVSTCPKITKNEPPVVVLTVAVRGREADIVELDPSEALKLGASLMRDANLALQLQPHQMHEVLEEE